MTVTVTVTTITITGEVWRGLKSGTRLECRWGWITTRRAARDGTMSVMDRDRECVRVLCVVALKYLTADLHTVAAHTGCIQEHQGASLRITHPPTHHW